MRRLVRGIGGVLVLAVLLTAAPPARAGEVTLFGGHAAYYDEYRKGAIGLNARSTFGTSPLSTGFKFDYLFRPHRETWVFEADLQYDLPLSWKSGIVWVGGGGGILRDDPNGPVRADLDPLASAFVGVGYKQGPLLPYFEVRLTSHETARWVYYVGLRF
jgi:hypothetical protein